MCTIRGLKWGIVCFSMTLRSESMKVFVYLDIKEVGYNWPAVYKRKNDVTCEHDFAFLSPFISCRKMKASKHKSLEFLQFYKVKLRKFTNYNLSSICSKTTNGTKTHNASFLDKIMDNKSLEGQGLAASRTWHAFFS